MLDSGLSTTNPGVFVGGGCRRLWGTREAVPWSAGEWLKRGEKLWVRGLDRVHTDSTDR